MTEQKPRELWIQKGSFTEMIVEDSQGYNWTNAPVKFVEASALDAAKAEIEKLRKVQAIQTEALRFYSSEASWDCGIDYVNNQIDDDDIEMLDRIIEGHDCSDLYGGNRARQALQQTKEIMGEK